MTVIKLAAYSIKMGADKLAENTPNAPNLICRNCLPSPKVWCFTEKRLYWASVVRVLIQDRHSVIHESE